MFVVYVAGETASVTIIGIAANLLGNSLLDFDIVTIGVSMYACSDQSEICHEIVPQLLSTHRRRIGKGNMMDSKFVGLVTCLL